MTTSADIRRQLVERLEQDLIGPSRPDEVLKESPSRFYLTGWLVPSGMAWSASDPQGQDRLDLAGDSGSGDDEADVDTAAARPSFFPSSIGLSVLVPPHAEGLSISYSFGNYRRPYEETHPDHPAPPSGRYVRESTEGRRGFDFGKPDGEVKISGNGPVLVYSVRPVPAGLGDLPAGTRSVSIFLVNRCLDPDNEAEYMFQAWLQVDCIQGFVPRSNPRGAGSTDPDELLADLQYRDTVEWGVGHGVSAVAHPDPDGTCGRVSSSWMPTAQVEKVAPTVLAGVELRMDALAACASGAEVRLKVGPLLQAYQTWIQSQHGPSTGEGELRKQRDAQVALLQTRADIAHARIRQGLELLETPQILKAFQLTNRAMAEAARRRHFIEPKWHLFQLAFLLMNIGSLATPTEPFREVVDLLFFPTGGGKTEAYLGLAAFTLVLRRLRDPTVTSAGVSVLMRYTLRLLTLDQLGRAATLICALELERLRDVESLGPWPFEIGLWVGQAATPNRMGKKGDNNRASARARTNAYKHDGHNALPIPLESCPWCGSAFTSNSFNLVPNPDQPSDLRIVCMNKTCAFSGNRSLPIVTVDEPIYRRLPCFLIATLDKFASLPWVGQVGALFGKVDRHDAEGFYGACDPGVGQPLERPLLPPDLIIQDELHLISGPLGTMAGLYETAIAALCEREVPWDDHRMHIVRPKIVASTATVRRAEDQIRALFCRRHVEIFPPPGSDRRDSFFARTVPSSERAARLYVGVASPGRSGKVAMLKVYLALLSAAKKLSQESQSKKGAPDPADPYLTLVGYFNSLRELGGARRIVEDEVRSRLERYSDRTRVDELPVFADRTISDEVVELTSREATSKVASTKRRLERLASDPEHVDVALATNMISVGLDITRLGLMVVFGQPKSAAEYIQATSRVGRDDQKPGLVITLLNIHKPRDRSHYERFAHFHDTFYRSVEPTSVTPFSPRAIDRGLAGVVVGLSRHGLAELEPATAAERMSDARRKVGFVVETLGNRAASQALEGAIELRESLRQRTGALLDDWALLAADQAKVGAGLQYGTEAVGPPLLRDPLDPDLKSASRRQRAFRANRSLRDVEPTVNLLMKRIDGKDLELDDKDGS